MDRVHELLKYITKEHRGIEIGPYHNPLVPRRLGFNSIALDVFHMDELQRRAESDPHIPAQHRALIEEVDLVGSASDIVDLVKARYGNERFDYVISSHNLEHLPDPIRFLQGCEQVLKPGAILSMAIPDRRYCFDFYRPVTELSEWLDAFHEKRTRPTPGQVFRHVAYHSRLDGQIAWMPHMAGIPTPDEGLEAAYADWQALTQANGEGPYRDAHCWTFTPASFELLMADLRYLGILRLEIIEIKGPNGCEFYVHLRNPSGDEGRKDRTDFYRERAVIMRRLVAENRSGHSSKKISVAAIIPLYNGARFIREALNSVLAQTEPADEIIVVDDGSTDNGPEIVKEMARHHPIRLISQKNSGIGSARNRGVAECNSTHIALLDQDDIWYPDHIEVLKQPFVKGDVINLGVVYANLDNIDQAGRMRQYKALDDLLGRHPKTSLLQCLSQDMFILPGASLIAREAFDKVGGFDERLSGYEDDDLFLRMFSAGYRMLYLGDKSVLKWRIYSGSTSYSPRMAKSRMIYFRKLVENYPNEPRLRRHWTRDAIAPRFFGLVRQEFIDGMRTRDIPRMERAWSDINEILPFMRKRVRRRMKLVAPLINTLYRSPAFRHVTRGLLSFGTSL